MTWASVAALAVTTPQDLLELGDDGRINFPGKEEGNWTWRLPARFLEGKAAAGLAARLRALGVAYGRAAGPAPKG